MLHIRPVRWMVVGGTMMAFGAAGPFLMVIQVLEPTFLWVFASFAASTGGFLVGMVGLASYGVQRRPPPSSGGGEPFR